MEVVFRIIAVVVANLEVHTLFLSLHGHLIGSLHVYQHRLVFVLFDLYELLDLKIFGIFLSSVLIDA